MDIVQVLTVLRPGEDWGPCAQSDSSYADLFRTWRSEKNFCPSLEAMEACWAEIEANRPVVKTGNLRTAAIMATLGGETPSDVASRAAVTALFTRINDIAEAMIVLMKNLYTQTGTPWPNVAQLISEYRTQVGYDPVSPTPESVAADGIRRLMDPEIIQMLGMYLALGLGDPRTGP